MTFYDEHIKYKARFIDDMITMEEKDKEVIEQMKKNLIMDISGHKLFDFKFEKMKKVVIMS